MVQWVQDILPFMVKILQVDIEKPENRSTLRGLFESCLKLSSLPPAFIKQIDRTIKLIDHVSSGAVPEKTGTIKIRQSVDKMADSFPNMTREDILNIPVENLSKDREESAREPLIDTGLSLAESLVASLHKGDELFEQDLRNFIDLWEQIFSEMDIKEHSGILVAVVEEYLNNPDFKNETLYELQKLLVSLVFNYENGEKVSVEPSDIDRVFEAQDAPEENIEDNASSSVETSLEESFHILEIVREEIVSCRGVSDGSKEGRDTILYKILEYLEGYLLQKGLDRYISYLYSNAESLLNSYEISGESSLSSLQGFVEALIRWEKDGVELDFEGDYSNNVADQGGILYAIPVENRELLKQFSQNQSDVLSNFESMALNYKEGDPERVLGDIQAILHTWKGEFGVLDLSGFSDLCHQIEEVLESKESFHVDTLFRLKDLLQKKFKELKSCGWIELSLSPHEVQFVLSPSTPKTDKPVEKTIFSTDEEYLIPNEPDLVQGFIMEAREHIDSADNLILKLEESCGDRDHLDALFRAYHTIKGCASFLALEPIRYLSHAVEDMIDSVRRGENSLSQECVDRILLGTDELRELVETLSSSLGYGSYRVKESLNHAIFRIKRPLLDSAKPLEKKPREMPKAETEVSDVPDTSLETAKVESSGSSRSVSMGDTIRIPLERLDVLMDIIGEAVIAQSMVMADDSVRSIVNHELQKKISQAELIMRQLQSISMSLRMVSVRPVFQKMARLVRDLSKKLNKGVRFQTEGEDTEIDKSLVESIGDPLIHMVRNALDHGIESSIEERRALGKPDEATITLKAYHKSSSVYIEIVDDGRGIDVSKIRQKAVNLDLCTKDEDLTDNQVLQFIFAAGFSTASEITDVSGRGVGMDVVRRNIEEMRGSVHISTELGRGTIFSIRLPLTLAIIDGMVVRSSGELYVVPKLSIVKSFIYRDVKINNLLGDSGSMILFEDHFIPFSKLSDLFGMSSEEESEELSGRVVVIEDLNGERVALHIDEILGQQQVVLKNLGNGIGQVDGIAGGSIMSDGSVSLIIDVAAVISMARV